MELSLISAKPVEVMPFDMSATMEQYKGIADVAESLGGGILYRVKMPSSGNSYFNIMAGDENMCTPVDTITGVVIHSHRCNARFVGASLKDPPICSSMDGIAGVDRESGEENTCKDCPYNAFGTSDKGPGKACKNMIRLYIMTKGIPMPLMLSLPPTSLNNWKNYRMGTLLSRGVKPEEVVTEITTIPATSGEGKPYSIAKFKLLGKLNESDAAAAKFFASGFQPAVEVTAEDYSVGDADGQ